MSDTKKYSIGEKVKIIGVEYSGMNDRMGMVGTISRMTAGDSRPYKVSFDDGQSWSFNDAELKPAVKTLFNLEKGDVLIDEQEGSEMTVLAVCDGVYGLSEDDDPEVFNDWFTPQEIEECGWTIKQDAPTVVEKTMADVEKELKLPAGTLRIKKDAA